MRILHTADWHLGKMFYGEYLTEEQAYVLLQQFLPMIREEHIDAVILAGDVYDRSLPPTAAVELFDEVATKITAELGVPFFIISGNHDSEVRLSFASSLLAKQGLYIAGEFEKLSAPVRLADAYGPVQFVLLPFAEPAMVRHFLHDDTIHTHEEALQRLMAYQLERVSPCARTVCVAHAFVAGGIASDSERPLSIGGSDVVAASLFDDFTYTALGHLHGPQKVSRDTTRYAGSLLKYSFGEAHQKKGAVIVDIDGNGTAVSQQIPFAPLHDVRVIDGFFENIMNAADDRPDDYVLVRLQDREPILDGMAKLRRKYCRAMALETPNRQSAAKTDQQFDLRRITERQLFDSFAAAMQEGRSLTEAEQACVDELWKTLLSQEGEGLL
ncbi:MAG: exonuclease SbcCD subunit D [Megasphaera sp.]|nr:exonuclease SbcCD subunit D [Megasphaera sp.]MCI1248157.1 exonuclease SbcCD subunit D [Megasphaera sp.]